MNDLQPALEVTFSSLLALKKDRCSAAKKPCLRFWGNSAEDPSFCLRRNGPATASSDKLLKNSL
jgi:hypothetical protein